MQNRSGYVDTDGGQVYFEVAGEGTPVVFLHTAFADSGMWDDQWQDFSQHHSVIRYDMCGFGRSDPMARPVSRRQELYRVLEAAGTDRAVLVGCSLGGEVAIDVALERPEIVSGLVPVSAAPGGFELQGEPPRYLMEMLAAVEKGDLDRASELQMRIWLDGPSRRPEEVIQRARQRAAEMSRAALAKGGWGLALAPVPDPLDPPAAQQLDRIAAPTLVVAGALDDPEILRAADVMARSIPGAQKLLIPGAAHVPSLEKPAEFNRFVEDFLVASK